MTEQMELFTLLFVTHYRAVSLLHAQCFTRKHSKCQGVYLHFHAFVHLKVCIAQKHSENKIIIIMCYYFYECFVFSLLLLTITATTIIFLLLLL